MKISECIGGLQILQSYYDNEYNLGAEHDVLYAYATTRPLTPEDVQKMADLNWHQPEASVDGEWLPEHYDPEESWASYT